MAVFGRAARRLVFRSIYERTRWGSSESRSGWGSELRYTQNVRRLLPELIKRLDVETLLDAPCGDFNWMRRVDLGEVNYVGVDIVPELVAENRRKFAGPRRTYLVGDVTSSRLPRADLILCRDGLVHLSLRDVWRAIKNFKRSGSYLLTTTFPGNPLNRDIVTGEWRPLDLTLEPFGFPPPLVCEKDDCMASVDAISQAKSLGLWRLADLKP